jgi:hypothetical protein
MRGKTVSLDFFCTTTRYRVLILHYEYTMSPFSLHIYKGNEGNGYVLGTRAGPSLLSWVDLSCVMVFLFWMLI